MYDSSRRMEDKRDNLYYRSIILFVVKFNKYLRSLLLLLQVFLLSSHQRSSYRRQRNTTGYRGRRSWSGWTIGHGGSSPCWCLSSADVGEWRTRGDIEGCCLLLSLLASLLLRNIVYNHCHHFWHIAIPIIINDIITRDEKNKEGNRNWSIRIHYYYKYHIAMGIVSK